MTIIRCKHTLNLYVPSQMIKVGWDYYATIKCPFCEDETNSKEYSDNHELWYIGMPYKGIAGDFPNDKEFDEKYKKNYGFSYWIDEAEYERQQGKNLEALIKERPDLNIDENGVIHPIKSINPDTPTGGEG